MPQFGLKCEIVAWATRTTTVLALATVVLAAASTSPAMATGPRGSDARISMVRASGAFTWWPASPDVWAVDSALLGTALGSAGKLTHVAGWDGAVALELGRALARVFASSSPAALDLELRYGRDRFTLSEQLAPIHQGAARRYDLGDLRRQRLALSLGTSFVLRRGAPRLVVDLHVGLIDRQYNDFRVNDADPELRVAIGGAPMVTADDEILWFNPLDVSLRCDLTRHAFLLAGVRHDRLQAPLHWTVAGAAPGTQVRDQLAVEAGVVHAGAGWCW